MKFFLSISLILPALSLLCLISEAGDSRTLSRDEAIRLAFSRRADLAAARITIDRAATRARWSGRLENPTFDFEYKGDGVGQAEGEQTATAGFSQRFPITSRLKHEKNLRNHQILLAEAEVAERGREIAGEIDLALIALLATRERQRLSRESLKTTQEIVSFLETQAEKGETSKLDSMQAKLTAKGLEQDRERLALTERQQQLELLRLVGLSASTTLQLTDSLSLPTSSPPAKADFDSALKRRPDYALALAKIDEAKAALVLENAKRWEDISVSLFVEDEHSVDLPRGMDKNTFAGFGFSIPLPLRQRNQEGIAQAKLDEEEAQKSTEAVRFSIQSDCDSAYRSRIDAWNLAREAAGELPALAEKHLGEVRKVYESGEATYIQVSQAQEQLLQARRTALDFLVDYHQAEARVRLATGAYPSISTPSRNSSK